METKHSEQQIYQLQHEAVNEPLRYISEINNPASKYKSYPLYLRKLFLARAFAIAGNVQQALAVLKDIRREITKSKDSFSIAKFNLVSYSITTFVHVDDMHDADAYYQAAGKYAVQSGSMALKCEWNLLQVQKADKDMGLEDKEDLLEEAMQAAMDADILDLKLDVYLAYCPLYIGSNLLERANRELQLLLDMVDREHNPYLYTHICNYLGVILMMLKEYSKSEDILNQGISVAELQGYKPQLTTLLLNLGINYVHSGRMPQSIAKYQECHRILTDCGLESSVNAYKSMDNMAMALGRLERYDESIALMRVQLENSLQTKNRLRENILKVNLANILIETESFAESEQLLEEAIEYFSSEKSLLYLTIAYRCTARMFEAKGCYHEAFDALEMLDNKSRQYFNENFFKQSAQYNARIEKLRNEYLQLKRQYAESKELNQLCLNAELIGEHPSIKKAIKDAFMAAKYLYANVLITGESGTGKEIIAQIIHNESKTGKQLVAVNASAISPNLIESELFGHKKGSYTGAFEDRKGKFLLADKGTLLLDEIADMPADAQVKLLRAIETHTIQPVGSDKEISVNCRIISTSNCDIKDLIHKSKFRLDLYHRLNKVEIHLPPLRERMSDLQLLTMHFVKRFSASFQLPVPQISEEFWTRLESYNFPGNIRELMNIVERIFILKPKAVWNAEQLDGLLSESVRKVHSEPGIQGNLKQAEYQMIASALEQTGWMQKDAAKLLNMPESTLSRKIKTLGIRR
jgi:DNA-binding NtrC family response regulator